METDPNVKTQQAISELISTNFPRGIESSIINENAFLMELKEERRKCIGIKEKKLFLHFQPKFGASTILH